MKISKHIAAITLAIVFAGFLAGCGSNVFSGVSSPVTDPTTMLAQAQSKQDFQNAFNQIQILLADPNISTANKQALLIQRMEAALGANELSTIDLVGIIAKLGENNPGSLFSALNLPAGIDLANLLKGVDGANAASSQSSIGTFSTASTGQFQPLNTNSQLLRAAGNLFLALKILDVKFDVLSNGNVVTRNAESAYTSLGYIVDPFSTGGTTKSLSYFINQALDAFTSAGILKTSQEDIVEQAKTAGQNTIDLYEDATNGTTFTIGIHNYDFSTGNRDSKIMSALSDIFAAISNP